jgi:hypothetical protein
MDRPEILNSTVIQDRDFDLLRGFFESRVMTVGHVAILYQRVA